MRVRALLVAAVVAVTVAGFITPVAGAALDLANASEECEGLTGPPGEFDLGETVIGSSTTASYTFKNPTEQEVEVSGISVGGEDADAFSVSPSGTITVGPGECVDISITFTPTHTGDHDASLSASAGEETASTELTGVGVEPARPSGSISPSERDFGSIRVGSSATATFVITNDGEAPLAIESASVSGGNFSIVGGVPSSIAPGKRATVQVRFSPGATGNQTGTLTVMTNETNSSTLTSSLIGEGIETELAVEPTSFTFGNVSVGETAERTVSIENTGTEPVTLTSIGFPGQSNRSAFSIVSVDAEDRTLESGESASVTVAFAPQRAKAYAGTVIARTDSDRAPTIQLSLSGTGTASDIGTSTGSLNFGRTETAERSTRTLTVVNRGTEPLNVDGLTIGGANPGAFNVLSGGAPFTVPPGGSHTIELEFVPPRDAEFSASLSIASDDPDEPTTTVYLSNTLVSINQDSQTNQEGTTTADVEVTDAEANDTITLTFGSSGEGNQVLASGAAGQATTLQNPATLTTMNLTIEEGGDFSLGLASGPQRLTTTPQFYLQPRNGTEPVGYMNVSHTISDENIAQVEFTQQVSKQRLAELNASIEDFAMYRFVDGEWVELNTTVVGETDTYYEVRATSPGLSDFTSGVKQPKFRLVDADVTVTQITTGDDVGVRVDIRNDGGADGTYTTRLLFDDEPVAQKDVTIAADSKRVVTFEQEITEPGTYTVVVNNVTINDVQVTAEELNQTATSPTEAGGSGATSTGGGSNSAPTPGFGVVIAVLALLAGARLLGRRD